MRIYKLILDGIIKIAEVLLMFSISGIALLILHEIFIRNVFNRSFRGVVELSIFFFIWVIFLGFMVNYHRKRLVALDTVFRLTKGRLRVALWYLHEIVSVCLGIVMIIAFIALYPFFINMYFSTLRGFSRIWQHLPLVIAGGFIIVSGIYNIIARISGLGYAEFGNITGDEE